MSTKIAKLKNPIILVPGMIIPQKLGPFSYFSLYKKFLELSGNKVYVVNLPILQSIERRARDLKKEILQVLPNESDKAHIIAHSIGGLNARYMISVLGTSDKILSLTTINTPHRGSVLADFIVKNSPIEIYRAFNFVMKKVFSSSIRPILHITSDHMNNVFNQKVLDSGKVKYFSLACFIPPPIWRSSFPYFWLSHKILDKYEGKNDGLVSVNSAKWGVFLGKYQGDHFSAIGIPPEMTFFSNQSEILSRIVNELTKIEN